MRDSYIKQSKNKTVLYAILIVVILGVAAIAVQDINIATEHTSQEIELKLEK